LDCIIQEQHVVQLVGLHVCARERGRNRERERERERERMKPI